MGYGNGNGGWGPGGGHGGPFGAGGIGGWGPDDGEFCSTGSWTSGAWTSWCVSLCILSIFRGPVLMVLQVGRRQVSQQRLAWLDFRLLEQDRRLDDLDWLHCQRYGDLGLHHHPGECYRRNYEHQLRLPGRASHGRSGVYHRPRLWRQPSRCRRRCSRWRLRGYCRYAVKCQFYVHDVAEFACSGMNNGVAMDWDGIMIALY